MQMIPGSYIDPVTGMHIFPERPEELLTQRVEALEQQVAELSARLDALTKR